LGVGWFELEGFFVGIVGTDCIGLSAVGRYVEMILLTQIALSMQSSTLPSPALRPVRLDSSNLLSILIRMLEIL
jgi:hypothetical protein